MNMTRKAHFCAAVEFRHGVVQHVARVDAGDADEPAPMFLWSFAIKSFGVVRAAISGRRCTSPASVRTLKLQS
jgi:hypothetical protein